MLPLWQRVPVLIRAVLTGLALTVMGTTPWAVLATLNLKYANAVPWAVVVTAPYYWLFWRWVRGWGWPRSTSEARRANARVHSLSDEAWGAALFAGIVGLVTVLILQGVMNRMVRLPMQSADDLSNVPLITLAVSLLMASVVAGLVEEVSFRGYMQGPIERRHGPLVAILVTGSLFGFLHFTHPEVTLILMPYYLAVAAVYGMLAYLTSSVLPSMILHAGGNVFSYIGLVTMGRSEWQATSTPAPLIWETGADASFWLLCVGLLVMTAATVGAYAVLARVARKATA